MSESAMQRDHKKLLEKIRAKGQDGSAKCASIPVSTADPSEAASEVLLVPIELDEGMIARIKDCDFISFDGNPDNKPKGLVLTIIVAKKGVYDGTCKPG